MDSVRLNKFLAERLGISRREADELIARGEVLVNEKPGVIGQRVDKSSKVCYNGRIVAFMPAYLYVALNKPEGYVCSRKQQGEAPTIYAILPKKYQELKTVGRLDKNSSGLILMTNDGDFAFRMTHPKFYKDKKYIVTLDRELEPLHQQMIADFGIEIGDGVSKMGLVRLDETRRKFEVTLHEGRNRQIRRTFLALGYKVEKLHRISFGEYELAGLKPGEYVEIKIAK
ncbi:rRNA pseudouridine synthase [Candidatus Saccharibacteria bacterium]|nr:rRNA pseudouridine synthase [Candidatus Saccharibacteria bacterium]